MCVRFRGRNGRDAFNLPQNGVIKDAGIINKSKIEQKVVHASFK